MKSILRLLLSLIFSVHLTAQERNVQHLDNLLTQWHQAASEADFETYTNLMTSEAVFIGTDATENWKGQAFRDFAKPYFDRGKAWSFSKLERHIFFNAAENTAWFDELLSTQMGICRGSGVLIQTDAGWKIAHYVLSIAVPNEHVDALTKLKQTNDQQLIEKLKNN
ncbi:MAG: nuclear transport factor 2 family protein [Flavobacteriaceae bacterium]|nr:nuclear transport factor 2 family protein [Flavobacteriaceae bacterium]